MTPYENAMKLAMHYARGYGMLSGMIETIGIYNKDPAVAEHIDKALAFIAEHDGKRLNTDNEWKAPA